MPYGERPGDEPIPPDRWEAGVEIPDESAQSPAGGPLWSGFPPAVSVEEGERIMAELEGEA